MVIKKHTINNIQDYNDVAQEILDNYLETFITVKGLTIEPTQEDYDDFGGEEIGWMYTQKGMKLYNSAVRHLTRLGERLFSDSIDLDIRAVGMLFA
jgi:hypothetical protein